VTFDKPSPVGETVRQVYVPCEVATDTRDAVLGTIEDDIANDPRTMQTAIGPSAVGDPCDWCLGHRLAEIRQTREAATAWLPWVGKSVHKGLESIFRRAGPPWMPEARGLRVGDIDGEPVLGTSDLMRLLHGDVVDFKLVGDKALTAVRQGGPIPVYRTQGHLYGRGWSLLGFEVKHVAILYLPRNRQTLGSSVWWAEEYDEQVALDALARADELAKRLRTLGPESVLPTLAKMPGCYDCRRWERL
jgi:hypothetical protein